MEPLKLVGAVVGAAVAEPAEQELVAAPQSDRALAASVRYRTQRARRALKREMPNGKRGGSGSCCPH
jgi:hypothetical protein